MVAHGREGVRQAGEDTLAVVADLRHFAVLDLARARHDGAVSLADALVAETNAEQRHLAGEALDRLDADPGVLR
ncbi:hypothetical protein D3C83_194940 [compost metagenome]